MSRSELLNIETEKELFTYYVIHSKFVSKGRYSCAGVSAPCMAKLFPKLKETWLKEISEKATQALMS